MGQPPQDPMNQSEQSSSYSQSDQPSAPPPPPSSLQGSYPPGEEGYYNQLPPVEGPITQYRAGLQGKLDGPSKSKNGWRTATLIFFVLVLILAATTATLIATRPSSSPPVVQQPTSVATQAVQPSTSTSSTGTPTGATTPSSTAAAQPVATVAAGTITENITLTCNGCNDPIRVKIDTAQIDTTNGRMVWDTTLTDITGSGIGYEMSQFDLQASASQTQIPATFSQGSGSLVSNVPTDIQAIFAFVPYQKVAYTLTVVVYFGQGTTTFNPVTITF